MNKLTGSLVKLRALEPEDLNFLYNIENDESYWEVSNTQKPYSRYLLKQYLENSHLDIYEAKQLRFAIENTNNEIVGMVDLFDYSPQHLRAGVGVLIAENYQKKGYATQALQLFHQYAFSHLNIKQLYTNISIDNSTSISLFEKLNYQKVGIRKNWILSNGKFKDVLFYQLFDL